MLNIIKSNTNINFMGQRKLWLVISLIAMAVSIVSLSTRGLNLGLDFTGGTLIEVSYPHAPEIAQVREALADGGYPDAMVQTFGTAREIVVRLQSEEDEAVSAEISTAVLEALATVDAGVEMRRVEFVGPQMGRELAEKGGLAMLFALFGVLIYVAFRFQWRFGVAAVAALVHDLLIVAGIVSLLGVGFDLTVVAALLAVIGYSLNDTIVLFDRLRENFRTVRKKTPLELTNLSINQMLGRTVMTSLTTLLVLVALFYFGGELIHAFAFTLIVGVVVGTYSSIYIAGTMANLLGVSKQDLMQVEKEGADQPDLELPARFRHGSEA